MKKARIHEKTIDKIYNALLELQEGMSKRGFNMNELIHSVKLQGMSMTLQQRMILLKKSDPVRWVFVGMPTREGVRDILLYHNKKLYESRAGSLRKTSTIIQEKVQRRKDGRPAVSHSMFTLWKKEKEESYEQKI